MANRTGLYIHIPFCVRKCNYCAFLSFNADGSPRKEYSEALIREIAQRAEACGPDTVIDTVYIGGGTPSVMDVSQLSLIMNAVTDSFDIRPDAEITMEVNPGTLGRTDRVTRAKLQAYRFMGINRLSMGVQSMNNDMLHFLGRIHTAEDVARDMRFARKAGFDNINLDLIFSVPGQTQGGALRDLEQILAMEPEHISCYSLQIEEGTPFRQMADRGEIAEVPDEEDRETYHAICDVLRSSGYEHYEISNFARSGGTGAGFGDGEGAVSCYRSRHNSLYWDMSDYIGAGLGASGFLRGTRYRNLPDMQEYLSSAGRGELPVMEEHRNTAFDNISEAVFTGLRRREGVTYSDTVNAGCRVSRDPVPSDPEQAFWEIYSEARSESLQFAAGGRLITDSRGLRLTEEGIDISNTRMACFV